MQGFLFFSAIFSQGCTFLIYLSTLCYFNGNGFTCKVGWGTVWSIVAFSAYLIASLFLCFSPKHDPSTCCYDDDTKQYDEEQPAPAEQKEKAAEATVAAAAVVQEDKKQPENAEAAVEEPQAVEEKQVAEETPVAAAAVVQEDKKQPENAEAGVEEPQAVEEKQVAEETPVAAAAPVKEEEAVEESSVAASATSAKEEIVDEPEEEPGQEVEIDDLNDGVKVSVKEEGISTRLEPSVTGTGPDPDDLKDNQEDPDGEKFVGQSIKANLSMKTSPW